MSFTFYLLLMLSMGKCLVTRHRSIYNIIARLKVTSWDKAFKCSKTLFKWTLRCQHHIHTASHRCTGITNMPKKCFLRTQHLISPLHVLSHAQQVIALTIVAHSFHSDWSDINCKDFEAFYSFKWHIIVFNAWFIIIVRVFTSMTFCLSYCRSIFLSVQ